MFQRFLDVDQDGRITAAEYEKLRAWVDSWEHLNGIVALRPGTSEKPAELAWHFPRGVPECPSPLYQDGRVFMVMNGEAWLPPALGISMISSVSNVDRSRRAMRGVLLPLMNSQRPSGRRQATTIPSV